MRPKYDAGHTFEQLVDARTRRHAQIHLEAAVLGVALGNAVVVIHLVGTKRGELVELVLKRFAKVGFDRQRQLDGQIQDVMSRQTKTELRLSIEEVVC